MNSNHEITNLETHSTARPAYEPPALEVVGSVYLLTQTSNPDDFCIPYFKKTFGNPDFLNFIPIATCSG